MEGGMVMETRAKVFVGKVEALLGFLRAALLWV